MQVKFFVAAAAGAAICQNSFIDEYDEVIKGWSPALILFKISPNDATEYTLEELANSSSVERDVVVSDAVYDTKLEAFEAIAFHVYDNHSVVVPDVVVFNVDLEMIETLNFEELMGELEHQVLEDPSDDDMSADRVLH